MEVLDSLILNMKVFKQFLTIIKRLAATVNFYEIYIDGSSNFSR